jgi:hypothetical protein
VHRRSHFCEVSRKKGNVKISCSIKPWRLNSVRMNNVPYMMKLLIHANMVQWRKFSGPFLKICVVCYFRKTNVNSVCDAECLIHLFLVNNLGSKKLGYKTNIVYSL